MFVCKKKKKIFSTLLCICLVIVCTPMHTIADEKMRLFAKAAVLMDADSYRVLYGINENEVLPMASTTKIMTLLITLENADLNDVVEVSSYAASMPDVQLNIRSSEQYYLKDLVYSMMLESHNDSAVAIAEHVGGSVEAFAKLMNEKANEIGCKDTWYITPNGLDAIQTITQRDKQVEKIHGTTAHDLAKILSYCITKSKVKEEFIKITQTQEHSFTDISGKRSFHCTNHNALLHMIDGAITGKTGYTGKAGYCYTGAVRRGDKTLVVALLACGWPNHKNYKWQDSAKLISYGFENFEKCDLHSIEVPNTFFNNVLVINDDGSKQEITLKSESDKEMQEDCFLKRKEDKIYVTCERVKQMSAPVYKNQVMGNIKYYCGTECVEEITLKAGADIIRIEYWDLWKKVAEYFLF